MSVVALILSFLYEVLLSIPQSFLDLFKRQKPKQVVGKVVVITGASGGFGSKTAELFAKRGAKLALLDIVVDEAERVAQKLRDSGYVAHAFKADVTDPDNMQDVAEQIRSHSSLGPADIVICNAGVLNIGPLANISVDDVRLTMNVNVLGYFWTIRAFLSGMIDQRSGHICAIASMAGHYGNALSASYSASKFAVRGLMESLEWELHDLGLAERVKITTVFPFFARTPLIKNCNLQSNLVDVISADEAAEGIVDGIMNEKLEVYIPWFTSLLAHVLKPILFHRLKHICRRYFGIHYDVPLKPVDNVEMEREE